MKPEPKPGQATGGAVRVAAITGFLAVALGAFGAHGLKGVLEQTGGLDWWRTGSLYHLVHSAVLLWIAGRTPVNRWAYGCCLAGILLFSGSLYAMGITGIRGLGAVTPLGGVAFLAGWLALALRR